MTGEEIFQNLIAEIEKRERRSLKTNLSWESLKELLKGALDPKPEAPEYVPVYSAPVIPPLYPKLKVRYGGPGFAEQEWIMVHTIEEEAPYHMGGWLTVDKNPKDYLEKLKANGIPEAMSAEWERRKQQGERGNNKS